MLISATRKPCFENVHDNGLPDNGAARRGGVLQIEFRGKKHEVRVEDKCPVHCFDHISRKTVFSRPDTWGFLRIGCLGRGKFLE